MLMEFNEGIDGYDFMGKMKVTIFKSEECVPEGVMLPEQVHGNRVAILEADQRNFEDCDALISSDQNLMFGVKTADCAPICFADGSRVGVAHVGWRGLCLGLAQKMLLYFDKASLEIFVGPHLHTFEVKKDNCYTEIEKVFGTNFFTGEDGKIFFQFKEALLSCLPEGVVFDQRSTGAEFGLPSHRLNGTKERIITVVQFT